MPSPHFSKASKMNSKPKSLLIALGAFSAILIVSQLVMGLLIVRGGGGFELNRLIKTHQHSGYLAVTVTLVYVIWSISILLSIPAKNRP